MILGTYTLPIGPLPTTNAIRQKRRVSYAVTLGGVSVVDWGVTIVGEIVSLPFNVMSKDQFDAIQEMVESCEEKTFDPEGDHGHTYTVQVIDITSEIYTGNRDSGYFRNGTVTLLVTAQLT